CHKLRPRGREPERDGGSERVADDVGGCEIAIGNKRGQIRGVLVDAALRWRAFALAVAPAVVRHDPEGAAKLMRNGIPRMVIAPGTVDENHGLAAGAVQ